MRCCDHHGWCDDKRAIRSYKQPWIAGVLAVACGELTIISGP